MFEQGVAVVATRFEPVYKDSFQKWRYLAGEDLHRKENYWKHFKIRIHRDFCARWLRLFCLIPTKILSNHLHRKSCWVVLISQPYICISKNHNWVVFHGPMPSGDFSRG